MNQVPRYEINRQVRRVLVRHGVDLSKMSFSCTQRTAHFRGKLLKEHHGEFDAPTIETLCKDIERLPYGLRLVFDVDNWTIGHDAGAWNVAKVKRGTGGGGTEERTYVVDAPESVDDAMEERERKKLRRK